MGGAAMNRNQLAAIELAADQVLEAHMALASALETLQVQIQGAAVNGTAPRGLAISITAAEISRMYCREVVATLGRLLCDRRPCDRVDGICPRCQSEAETPRRI